MLRALLKNRFHCPNGFARSARLRVASGLTLLEVLVVIVILGLVTTLTMSTAPSLDQRRIRESIRELSGYLSLAKARAHQTGRSAGVRFEPVPGTNQTSMKISIVQVPLPYTGDTFESRVFVSAANGLARFATPDSGWLGQVRRGDLMRLNYSGLFYRIESDQIDNEGLLTNRSPFFRLSSEIRPPVATPPSGVPFQIFLQPRVTADAPMTLPTSTMVDLSGSGLDGRELEATTDAPITILFKPDGSVDQLLVGELGFVITQPIYLLIGKRSNVFGDGPTGYLPNWEDPESRWVTVHAKTGLISSSDLVVADASISDARGRLYYSRSLARRGELSQGR